MKETNQTTLQHWLDETWGKIQLKLSAQCDRVGDSISYVPEGGRYREDMGESDIGT